MFAHSYAKRPERAKILQYWFMFIYRKICLLCVCTKSFHRTHVGFFYFHSFFSVHIHVLYIRFISFRVRLCEPIQTETVPFADDYHTL